jgi:imidazolonepropionase-like amidohydrolase
MMRRRSTVLALVTFFVLFASTFGGRADIDGPAAFLVLEGGRLIDGTGAAPIDDAMVIIGAGKILFAGPRDAAVPPRTAEVIHLPGMAMTEIRLMGDAGMTPMQIIVAATRHGTHVSNLERHLGTVETGKIADLLVVEGDPLTDLEDLRWVRLALRNGVIVRSELPPTTQQAPLVAGRRVGG